MRTVTAGETTLLQGAHYATFARVLVEDADGTYQDLTNQDSLDWVQSGTVAQSIDQIVATGNFTFWRKQEGGNSLAPLDEDSTLNRNLAAAYAPLIDVGRGIRCEFATVAIGSSPGGGDWQNVFEGVIDDWRVEDDFVNVMARDAIGAEIADRWVEQEWEYGTEAGRAVESVMQDILTEWTSLTLYTPVSPSFLVTTYRQQKSSVMDALQQLAALIGWVVRPKWDDGTSAFRLTFHEPERSASVAAWTWAVNRYEKVPDLSLSRLHIRNALSLRYTNATNVRSQVTAEDATSITDYDRQFMEIEESEDSPIDTAAEAQAMIDAALLDLKDPIANQELKTFCFWPVQLDDYYQFNANDVHYTANQLFGVTGFRHEFGGGHIDTFIRTRGKPAGFISPWIQRRPIIVPPEEAFALALHDLRVLHDLPAAGQVTVRWTRGSKVFSVWAYEKTLTQPIDDTDNPWPDDATLPAAVFPRGTDEIVITAPDSNGVAFLQLEPRADDGKPGNPVRVQIDPKALTDDWLIPQVVVNEVRTAGTSVVTINAEDPELRVTAIEYKKRDGAEGGDTLDASWQTAWTSTTGAIGASTTLQRVINVPVAAGLEGELQWRLQYTDIEGNIQTVGDSFKVVNLEATTGSVMVPYSQVIPLSDTTLWQINTSNSTVRPGSLSGMNLVGALELPPGVTVTEVELVGYRGGSIDAVQATLKSTPKLGTSVTNIVTVTHDTTGYQAKSASISELVDADNIYSFLVFMNAATLATDARFRSFKVLFDRPSYQYVI